MKQFIKLYFAGVVVIISVPIFALVLMISFPVYIMATNPNKYGEIICKPYDLLEKWANK